MAKAAGALVAVLLAAALVACHGEGSGNLVEVSKDVMGALRRLPEWKNNRKLLQMDDEGALMEDLPDAAVERACTPYVVRLGDTVAIIARRTGTTPKAIRILNPSLVNNPLTIGRTILVPPCAIEVGLPGEGDEASSALGPATEEVPGAEAPAADDDFLTGAVLPPEVEFFEKEIFPDTELIDVMLPPGYEFTPEEALPPGLEFDIFFEGGA